MLLKDLKLKGITYQKELLIIIMLWYVDIKQYEEIRKLTTG